MKNLIGVIVLVIAGVLAYFLLQPTQSTSENTEVYKDFAIEDTASVSKIFLSQPNGKKLLLTRNEEGTWIVNNDFEARRDAIKLILKTLHDIQIQGNVPQESFEWVVKRLATGSTKVEFYTGDKNPEKTWYIGDATASGLGTYMLLEKDGVKSSKPFITHLLMERGYLSTRFFLDPILWKERVVMKADPKTIKSVEVRHFYDTATSFKIEQIEAGKFKMTNLDANLSNEIPPSIAVPYLKEFEAIYYEYIDLKTDQQQLDSIYNAFPRHTIKVELNDGNQFEMKTYNMPVRKGAMLGGKVITYHPERMYLYSSYLGENVHAIVQNLTFDKVAARLEDFESSTTVEK